MEWDFQACQIKVFTAINDARATEPRTPENQRAMRKLQEVLDDIPAEDPDNPKNDPLVGVCNSLSTLANGQGQLECTNGIRRPVEIKDLRILREALQEIADALPDDKRGRWYRALSRVPDRTVEMLLAVRLKGQVTNKESKGYTPDGKKPIYRFTTMQFLGVPEELWPIRLKERERDVIERVDFRVNGDTVAQWYLALLKLAEKASDHEERWQRENEAKYLRNHLPRGLKNLLEEAIKKQETRELAA